MCMLVSKEKIMGFGYVIYCESDLCNVLIKEWLKVFFEVVGDFYFYVVFECVEVVMKCEKDLFCNVDFFYVLVYYFMGILIKLFMLIFVMSCLIGWVVYVYE